MPMMTFFSFLGSEQFFLVILPLTYWCLNRRLGFAMGLLVLANAALNDALKLAFGLPRPTWFAEVAGLTVFHAEKGFGLPSGHAQGAVAFWPFIVLALTAGPGLGQNRARKVGLVMAAILVACICVSRLYLGAHFPADVLCGLGVGLLFLLAFHTWLPRLQEAYIRWPLGRQFLAIGVVTALYLLVCSLLAARYGGGAAGVGAGAYAQRVAAAGAASWHAAVCHAGAFTGLMAGLCIARRSLPFDVTGSHFQKTARFFVGIVGVMVFWLGMRKLAPAPEPEILAFVRYTCTAMWIALGAPWHFVKAGLSPLRAKV